MKIRKDNSALCVVRDNSPKCNKHEGDNNTHCGLKDCSVIDSARRLMAMGLSMQEIEDLEVGQSIIEAMGEYALMEDSAEQTAEAIETTLRIVTDEIKKIDMELEMLNMRKRALKKRTQILGKIAHSLQSSDNDKLVA